MSDPKETGARTLTDQERAVALDDIPLPPEDLIDELDNSAASPGTDSAERKPQPMLEKEVAELDYVDGVPERRVPLQNKFRLDGQVIEEVRVLALTPAEVANILTQVETPDVYDFYAVMTKLPAAVVRGMRGQDGERVTVACYDFLPLFMKGGA
tara:strand:- start:2373 stop:2834 length:462 start_codon:yes stop_codon:yes gene_type:complete